MPGGVNPPPSVIASWPKPNYIDPVTQGNGLTVVCILFPSIGIFLVTARIYSRLFITKAPGLDDLFIIISLVFAIALAVMVIIADKTYDIGRHVWDIPISKAAGSRLNAWCEQWFYVAATCCVKISILLFYRRLSVTFSKAFLWATWVGIAFNVLYAIAFLLVLLLQCRPISAYWLAFDPAWLEAGNTFTFRSSEHISLPASAALSVLGDFYSTALPLCLVYCLNLPKLQKRALYSLFALGFLVVFAGIYRTILLNQVVNETYDFTWALWKTWICAIVEVYTAIFCASAPALKPFFRRFFIEPIATFNSGSGKRGYGFGSGHGKPYSTHRSEKSLKAGAGKGGAQMWSQDGSAVSNSHVGRDMDVEKIGVAVTQNEMHEMKDYEYRELQRRKEAITSAGLPKQHMGTQQDLDLQSELGESTGQNTSASARNSQDWILPPAQTTNNRVRSYRAQIETLPPLLSEGQLSGGLPVKKRISTQENHGKGPSTETSRPTAVGGTGLPAARRYSPQIVVVGKRSSGGTGGGLERHPSAGSARGREMRANQIRVARARDVALDEGVEHQARGNARPRGGPFHEEPSTGSRLDSDSEDDYEDLTGPGVGARRTERAVSVDRRTWRTNTFVDSSDEASLEESGDERERRREESASEETLALPRQGSRDDFHARPAGVEAQRVGVAL